MRFVKESVFDAPADVVFAFHERPDAFTLLLPPWQTTEILQPPTSLAVGTRVKMRARFGPVWKAIEAVHLAYEPGKSFTDEMVRGPFAKWVHRHEVEPREGGKSLLRDDVEYEVPLGIAGRVVAGWFVRREIERLFAFRHEVTRRYVEATARGETVPSSGGAPER